jgi:hypothetical protein
LVEQACFKLLSLSIKLPRIHLKDRNKELAKSKVSTQIRIKTDRKAFMGHKCTKYHGRQKCSEFKESSEDTFSTAYRSYMTNHGAWQQSNGYSKAKLSAETAQDPEHYTAYHHRHTSTTAALGFQNVTKPLHIRQHKEVVKF